MQDKKYGSVLISSTTFRVSGRSVRVWKSRSIGHALGFGSRGGNLSRNFETVWKDSFPPSEVHRSKDGRGPPTIWLTLKGLTRALRLCQETREKEVARYLEWHNSVYHGNKIRIRSKSTSEVKTPRVDMSHTKRLDDLEATVRELLALYIGVRQMLREVSKGVETIRHLLVSDRESKTPVQELHN